MPHTKVHAPTAVYKNLIPSCIFGSEMLFIHATFSEFETAIVGSSSSR